MITRLDGSDGAADLLDDPGSLMAENAGQRERQSAAGDAQVGVTEASGNHLDENLVPAKLVELDVR